HRLPPGSPLSNVMRNRRDHEPSPSCHNSILPQTPQQSIIFYCVPGTRRNSRMVVRPELDILVTWNFRHIANLSVERQVRAITLGSGYEFNFRIMTPEEVVVYEV
ncbi:MAG: hypothetical protein NTX53_15425, partial [candidate division WOR-3 bacterium]|nr:hypothetical protein [candidate division WOR-3 bacterium]